MRLVEVFYVASCLLLRESFARADDGLEDSNVLAELLRKPVISIIESGLNGVEIIEEAIIDNGESFFEGSCDMTSSISCKLSDSGESCESLMVPLDKCGFVDAIFTFEYCNIEESNVVNLIESKSTALVETSPVSGLDYSPLSPDTCRTFMVSRKINTCKRFFSASLKIEAKKDDEEQTYCYAWDFLRQFIRRPCKITSHVTCQVDSTNEDCEDFIVPIDECKNDEDMTFTFEFCNIEPSPLRLRKPVTKALIETVHLTDLDLSDLPPDECRTFISKSKIDTCKNFFSASLKVEGWRGDLVGDYCYAWDFLRIHPMRPENSGDDDGSGNGSGKERKCDISAKIKCTITGTGEDCNDIIVPRNECEEEVNMTFDFEYCSNEEDDVINVLTGAKTIALVETTPVDGLDLASIAPGECRTKRVSRRINMCKNFFSASLKVEGIRGDNGNNAGGDYCYAWNFYRSYISRPQSNPAPSPPNPYACAVTAEVKCTVDKTGEDCDDIIVPLDACEENVDMTFEFKYCNAETSYDINLHEDKTSALVETTPVDGLNENVLEAGQCRRKIVTRAINTCKRFFSASLKVEGLRDEVGGYCYGWHFYRSYITRFDSPPNNSPREPTPSSICAISAGVSCTVADTGEDCGNMVVPLDKCKEKEDMIFEFEYCNFEVDLAVDLLEEKTTALVETTTVDNLNKSNLSPGDCRRRIVTRSINTCKRFFSASLKVEAIREEFKDYCYAYDFYRSYIDRGPKGGDDDGDGGDNVPTPSSTCEVTAEVSCIVSGTGQDCDDIVVPLDQCSKEVDMDFQFRYCSNEQNSDINLDKDLTSALVETSSYDGLNKNTLSPGSCRTQTITRKIKTCKRFFSASLKVEGIREGTGDYCYGWDFFRSYIDRDSADDGGEPTPAPPCDVSATVACKVDRTGESCDDLLIPIDQCNENEMMTFVFEYCSDERDLYIDLHQEKTAAVIETSEVPNLNIDPLAPGDCRKRTVKRRVNTCKRFFSASLKVEGIRGGLSGYCFAWDFYRAFIKRPGDDETPTKMPSAKPRVIASSFPSGSPSLSPQPSLFHSQGPTDCSGLNEKQREARIRNIISTVSNTDDLLKTDSPQSRARDWLIYDDTFDSLCASPCSRLGDSAGVIQRYVLAVFYFSTNGDNLGVGGEGWLTCGRDSIRNCRPDLTEFQGDPINTFSSDREWLSPVSECLWGGLACREENSCLDRIEFEANNLGGTIPFELEQLNQMRFLYIEGALNDEDYESGGLELVGGGIPSELVTLDDLLVLDLNYNVLNGKLPVGIFSMTKLRQLDLNHNKLTGSIPTEVGNLTKLRFLQLDNNGLTGSIPNEVEKLTEIITLEFFNNRLTGRVPGGLCTFVNTIEDLTADCGDPNARNYVFCGCCTACYPLNEN